MYTNSRLGLIEVQVGWNFDDLQVVVAPPLKGRAAELKVKALDLHQKPCWPLATRVVIPRDHLRKECEVATREEVEGLEG
jgi:hypothetical protein